TLEAGTYISTGLLTAYGKNRGGNIKLTANGDIFTSSIRTFSAVANGGGKGGNISIVSTNGSINTTNNDSYGNNGTSLYTAGLNGNSGSVTLEAYDDIITNEIRTASDNNGNGGIVKLTSQTGKIDTKGHRVYSYSNTGNAGRVVLNAYSGITVGEINAYAFVKAGEVRLQANQDISTKLIFASSQSNDGNKISITSVYVGMVVGSLLMLVVILSRVISLLLQLRVMLVRSLLRLVVILKLGRSLLIHLMALARVAILV
ncbi:MAG: hypothetical protein ACK52Q_08355, partial [Pseudanabaena sp.]